MNFVLKMLADVDPEDVLAAEKDYFGSPRSMENLAITVSIFGAIVIGTLFALIYRKKKRKRYHHRHHQETSSQAKKPETKSGESSKRRRRRRRRSELPMNPTLAETGGLPPPRDENRQWP